ncbi:MAG: hypothetical protein HKN68_20405 [Saprospiraceae bacterium]|nr:hypothetical protein [Saprospiraceae bacterium]
MGKILYILFKIILITILPFIILIRGSVYIHEHYDPGGMFSLIGGVIITSIVLVLYFTVFYGIIAKKVGDLGSFKRRWVIAMLILGGYTIHGLFFISTSNVKSSNLKEELSDLHPLLRISVSTIIMLDKDLIITDASRMPEDYRKMGLPSKSSSLHFKQKDGYAYAMDLRTNTRHEFRNALLKGYFWAMGFNTLRHGGTGDHLHISLKCHYRPRSI